MPRAAAAASPTYRIGELAREFDVTTRAIRFYEDCGLLAPMRRGRQRVYSQRDRTRLKLTLRGKRLGLTLAEVKELVDMYESPRDTAPQLKKFLVVLATHREQLEQQLADLQATLAEVREQEREARRLLTGDARRSNGRGP
jgi:DNA-binding transcriptional MerR regulator